MKILVTGAKGMLGQDLCPILEDEGYEVIETDRDNLDITDKISVEEFILREKPQYVIHCAAYTNVEKAEDEQDDAEKINVLGTENIAKVCGQNEITMVYISTDYVFDGNKTEPYIPEDKVNPLNIYGITKLKGEEAVKQYCKKYYIARTSWLYGVHGNNFVEKMISLKDRNELKVVDDQTGAPTWTVELANGIVELLDEKDYGVYHICGSGSTTWYEFAKEIFNIMGENVNVVPCNSSEYIQKALRPKYSVMEPSVYTRNWKVALKDYMELRDTDESINNKKQEVMV